MATTITLTHEKKEYTLEYSRASARMIEAQGFDSDKLSEKPITMISLLFYGAFAKNHSSVKQSKMDTIFDGLKKRGELVRKLMEMYSETVNVLSDDDGGEGDEGNVGWETSEN